MELERLGQIFDADIMCLFKAQEDTYQWNAKKWEEDDEIGRGILEEEDDEIGRGVLGENGHFPLFYDHLSLHWAGSKDSMDIYVKCAGSFYVQVVILIKFAISF